MKFYDEFFNTIYRCNSTNETIFWYEAVMELIVFKQMYEIKDTDARVLVKAYLKRFEKNENTIIKKCWKL